MRTVSWLLVVLVLFAAPARAGVEQDKDKWQLDLAPMYLWAVNMDGTLKTGAGVSDVKMNFNDITNLLEGIFTVHFEGRRNQYGLLVDLSYQKLTGSQTIPPGKINVNFENKMAEFMGFYSFSLQEATSLDLLGGIRYYGLDTDVSSARSIHREQNWVDPVIGLRLEHKMTDKWKVSLRGDIGGFGAGSDYSLNGVLLLDYQPWKHCSFIIGFRALDLYYTDKDFRYDMTMMGPIVALNFRW